MSCVYSVVIQLNDYGKEDLAIEKLNNYLKENDHLGGEFKALPGRDSAGTKSPEITLLWGGLNYLHVEEFIELFESLDLEDSLLTIKYPDGYYRVIGTKGGP